jgi:ribosomal protein S18 acetylase RimI-like enzyme
MAVDMLIRRNGIGKLLLNSALDALKNVGINKVALVVFDANEIGNRFWESVGFIKRDDLVYRNRSINDDNI